MNTPLPTPLGTIAIVDDEPENLNVLDASLSQAAYRVILFPRGELALAAADEEPPDLLLLDIRMPGMDGFEVCRRFKANDRLRSIPIIFISALSETDDIAAGFECGGADYITKPFHEKEVLARVRAHLTLRQTYVKLTEQHVQLQTLEQHRDSLVHMVVHDMRSPLMSILGCLQLIKDGYAPSFDNDHLDFIRIAMQETQTLTRMVSTMIDLSRMETSNIPLDLKPLSVRDIFAKISPKSLDPSGLHPVTEHIAESCPSVLCDFDLTCRILTNLLANALKYSTAGSEIAFGADPDPDGVRFWVRDRGPGIPTHQHKRIFEKFGVANTTSDKRLPSTGLGLAFCKLAVESQSGRIGVESELKTGSTFWFTLPSPMPHPR
jgi:K+-sensing histidine kinase KdpD